MGKRTNDPTGVVGCTEECKNSAMVCLKNHTLVEFRPHRGWRGEFGFDWLRVNDELTPGHVPGHVPNEPPYEQCIIGSQKKGYTPGTPNAEAYMELKTEYHKLRVNSERAAPQNEYFIPWLNLYAENVSEQINNSYKANNSGSDLPVKPPFAAELRLIINVQGDMKPKELELVFPSEYLTIEYPTGAAAAVSPITIPTADACFAPNTPGINYDLPVTIKVKCIKEFSSDQYIDVWSHYYQHTQAEIDQIEHENKQLQETDMPALEQEKTALKTEVQNLETQIAALEMRVSTQELTVATQKEEIAALEVQFASKTRSNLVLENPSQADMLKAKVTELEQKITQKKAQLEASQKQLEDMQKELEAKKAELEEKKNQVEAKQQEIEQKNEQVTKNTEEMNKMQGRSLAGKLCVCANDAAHRKTCKLLLINVRTNFSDPFDPSAGVNGTQTAGEIAQFYRVLYQALVYPEMVSGILFDRSTDPKFKPGSNTSRDHFVNSSDEIKYANSDTYGSKILDDCFEHLKTEFYNGNNNYSKDETYPLFFFGVEGEGMAGVALRGAKIGLMFDGRVDSTLPHEGLHGVGLHHTHMDYYNGTPKYTNATIPRDFKYIYYLGFSNNHPDVNYNRATSNIMSYKKRGFVDDRFDTWRWQWQVIRRFL